MSINCADVIRYARQHVKLAPILAVGGTSDQPGLDFCQDVLNKILSRPFNWKWNRSQMYEAQAVPVAGMPITTTDGVWCYVPADNGGEDAALDVGWLERAYMERTDSTSDPKERQMLEVVQNLEVPWFKGQPKQVAWEIATQADLDNSANVLPSQVLVPSLGDYVLRVSPIPDAMSWDLFIDYQKKPVVLTDTTSDTFDPIPDSMAHVVRQMFLAQAYRFVDDRRADMEQAKAEAVLNEMMVLNDVEPDSSQFYPMRPIQWG